MSNLTTTRRDSPQALKARAVGRQMADAYRERVRQHKHELGLSTEEAMAKAEEPCSLSRVWEIQDRPPEEVTWADLEELNRNSPERALELWGEMKDAALGEVRSGELASAALEGRNPHPYQRARFLAIREELSDGWKPRNGIERQLIDQMAQAQAAVFFWLQRMTDYATLAVDEAVEKAAAMVDRFSRIFTRYLRALCNLRKLPPNVFIQNAGQVNVGQQQVNVAAGE